jgi:hypothetical protein
VYQHDFHFPHEKLNNALGNHLDWILQEITKFNITHTDNSIVKYILENNLTEDILKSYTKHCFKHIYLMYHLINTLLPDSESRDEFDTRVFNKINDIIKNFFCFR